LTPEGDIAITPNLAEALKGIRHPLFYRNIWADAVCINQKDAAKRGHQVQMMGGVYESAEGVLVWSGQDHSLEAQSTFRSFRHH
jgi:hypothetical protein